jgi:hypothetical protein
MMPWKWEWCRVFVCNFGCKEYWNLADAFFKMGPLYPCIGGRQRREA